MTSNWSVLVIASLAFASSSTLAEKTELGSSTIVGHRFEYDNGIYEVSETAKNWYLAKDDCTRRGMELVTIETLEEQQAIKAEISIYGEDFWTSASDNYKPFVFHWESTGHAVGPFLNWAPGQPGYGDWSCTALSHLDSYQWYVHSCYEGSMRYICEKRDTVDHNYLKFSFGDINYSISYSHLNWYEAKNECRMNGMRLVSIETEEEYDAIRQGVESFEKLESFWISLNDLGREGDLYWDSTGKALGPFNDWREGEPVLGVPDVQCTLMDKITNFDDTRRWKTHVCNFQNRYICESIPSSSKNHLLLKTADASFADEIQTDHGDQQLKRFGFRNSIYEISDVKVDWYFAQRDCKIRGMELLSIETQEEQDALANQIGAYRENFWTSGTVQNKYDPLLTWDSTGRLLWQYTNFGSSQINGSTTGYCLVMNYLDEFKWYETGCQTENLRYICEKKDSLEDEALKFSFGNNYYEAFPHRHIWWEANRDCRSRGMRLISIDNENVNNAINFVLTNLDILNYNVITSGNTHYIDYNLTWDSTGEEIGPYTNWAASSPGDGYVILKNEGGEFKWTTSGTGYASNLCICTAQA